MGQSQTTLAVKPDMNTVAIDTANEQQLSSKSKLCNDLSKTRITNERPARFNPPLLTKSINGRNTVVSNKAIEASVPVFNFDVSNYKQSHPLKESKKIHMQPILTNMHSLHKTKEFHEHILQRGDDNANLNYTVEKIQSAIPGGNFKSQAIQQAQSVAPVVLKAVPKNSAASCHPTLKSSSPSPIATALTEGTLKPQIRASSNATLQTRNAAAANAVLNLATPYIQKQPLPFNQSNQPPMRVFGSNFIGSNLGEPNGFSSKLLLDTIESNHSNLKHAPIRHKEHIIDGTQHLTAQIASQDSLTTNHVQGSCNRVCTQQLPSLQKQARPFGKAKRKNRGRSCAASNSGSLLNSKNPIMTAINSSENLECVQNTQSTSVSTTQIPQEQKTIFPVEKHADSPKCFKACSDIGTSASSLIATVDSAQFSLGNPKGEILTKKTSQTSAMHTHADVPQNFSVISNSPQASQRSKSRDVCSLDMSSISSDTELKPTNVTTQRSFLTKTAATIDSPKQKKYSMFLRRQPFLTSKPLTTQSATCLDIESSKRIAFPDPVEVSSDTMLKSIACLELMSSSDIQNADSPNIVAPIATMLPNKSHKNSFTSFMRSGIALPKAPDSITNTATLKIAQPQKVEIDCNQKEPKKSLGFFGKSKQMRHPLSSRSDLDSKDYLQTCFSAYDMALNECSFEKCMDDSHKNPKYGFKPTNPFPTSKPDTVAFGQPPPSTPFDMYDFKFSADHASKPLVFGSQKVIKPTILNRLYKEHIQPLREPPNAATLSATHTIIANDIPTSVSESTVTPVLSTPQIALKVNFQKSSSLKTAREHTESRKSTKIKPRNDQIKIVTPSASLKAARLRLAKKNTVPMQSPTKNPLLKKDLDSMIAIQKSMPQSSIVAIAPSNPDPKVNDIKSVSNTTEKLGSRELDAFTGTSRMTASSSVPHALNQTIVEKVTVAPILTSLSERYTTFKTSVAKTATVKPTETRAAFVSVKDRPAAITNQQIFSPDAFSARTRASTNSIPISATIVPAQSIVVNPIVSGNELDPLIVAESTLSLEERKRQYRRYLSGIRRRYNDAMAHGSFVCFHCEYLACYRKPSKINSKSKATIKNDASGLANEFATTEMTTKKKFVKNL
ncbi:hypothetical protein RTP6_000837 [Batrachochytrium dendrobatidis]